MKIASVPPAAELRPAPDHADAATDTPDERETDRAIGELFEIFRGVLPLVMLYFFATFFVIGFIADASLTSLVIGWKIVSLAHLIYQHKESPKAIILPPGYNLANNLILIASFMIISLMFLKLFVDEAGVLRMPPVGQTVMGLFTEYSHYASMLPVLAYFVFDILLFLRMRGDPIKREKIMQFLVYKDLFCTVPLIAVFSFTEIYIAVTGITGDQVEIFFSGSIAVIVFSSTIATEALNTVHRWSGGADKPATDDHA